MHISLQLTCNILWPLFVLFIVDFSSFFNSKYAALCCILDIHILYESHVWQVESSDLISYGLIPEFVGRFPVLVSLSALTENQLVQVIFCIFLFRNNIESGKSYFFSSCRFVNGMMKRTV